MAAEPAARLGLLAREHALREQQRRQLELLLAALVGEEHAATAVRDPARAVELHIADSLAALGLEPVREAARIADLGSGAGLPGLVLAVALPGVRVALVESIARRAALLRTLARRLELSNVDVVRARAESWTAGAGAMEVVTARALAPQPVVLEYAAPLLAPGGSLVDWRGRRDREEEARAGAAAAELGLALRGIRSVEPFPGADEHHLHVFEKVAATPARFPRRPGAARKRPLG